MRVTRKDLRKLIEPMVRECVEDTLEELLTEGHIKNTIQESVLKGDVISHVIAEVFKGMEHTRPRTIVANNGRMQERVPNVQQVQQVAEGYDADSDPVLQRIRELAHNPELTNSLASRRHAFDSQEPDDYMEQVEPLREQISEKAINWESLASAIPPDSDHVGLRNTVSGDLSQVQSELNPLKGVVGEGIDLNIIKALSEKSLWDKGKLNKFLSMDNRMEHQERRFSLPKTKG